MIEKFELGEKQKNFIKSLRAADAMDTAGLPVIKSAVEHELKKVMTYCEVADWIEQNPEKFFNEPALTATELKIKEL